MPGATIKIPIAGLRTKYFCLTFYSEAFVAQINCSKAIQYKTNYNVQEFNSVIR